MTEYLFYLEYYTEQLLTDTNCKTITLDTSNTCIGIYSTLDAAISAANKTSLEDEANLKREIYKYIYKVPLDVKISKEDRIKDEYFVMRVTEDV